MTRFGRIDIDTNDIKFNSLRDKLTHRITPLFNDITSHIKRNFPLLKRATGSWYINFCIDKSVIFFKVDPRKKEECIYISVCDEDFTALSKDLQLYVQLKPDTDPFKPGSFKRQAKISSVSDLKWAYKLFFEIYSMVMKRYRY